MKEITISVIVPVYNIANYIDRCLQSIISQNVSNIEVIVVNDGSTDKSSTIINRFASMDERIIVINKPNGGLSSARNAGIDIARGEYILHIDGDDWIDQGYLEAMYEFAKKNDLDVVISDYWKDFDNGRLNKAFDVPVAEEKVFDKDKWLEYFFERKATQSMFNKLYKTALYKKYNIEHPLDVSVGEDLATTPRLMYYAKRIGKLNKCYYHYIQRASSLTNDLDKKKTDIALRSLMRTFTVLREFFCANAYILDCLDKHRIAQIAIFVFTPQVDQNSELMRQLTKEYLNENARLRIRYSSKQVRIYSKLLKITNKHTMLYVLQAINRFAYYCLCKR